MDAQPTYLPVQHSVQLTAHSGIPATYAPTASVTIMIHFSPAIELLLLFLPLTIDVL